MITQLDIINDMLASTGTAPVTANDTRHPAYVKAYQKLKLVDTAVQSLGLWFNTEYTTLRPSPEGEVVIPTETLHCDPVDRTNDLTVRGKRLWDRVNRTFKIGKEIKVKLVTRLDLEEMPINAKEYLRARAKWEYYKDEDGAEPKLSNYRQDQLEAWGTLWSENLLNKDVNHFDSPASSRLRKGTYNRRLKV